METPIVFAKRKKSTHNIVLRLINREIGANRRPATHFYTTRKFYQNVCPNFSVVNLDHPPCFLRKFSPDGRNFIAFSSDQSSLEVYTYQGPAAAADLIDKLVNEPDISTNSFFNHELELRNHLFSRYFKLKHVVNITNEEQLNRECSLFTSDGRYVVVGAAALIPEEIRPHFYEIYTNNESITPNARSVLDNYSLYLVDLHQGRLCDKREFKVDKIFLSHNQGLYLYKDTFAVLSVQHQMIHIYQILDGMFVDIRKIGRFCYEDDHFLYNTVFPGERPFRDVFFNSLKHRLLAFLYKRAVSIMRTEGDPTELRKFYYYFESFNSLKMWKMQLLDKNHLFIKYASEDVVTFKNTDVHNEPQFFVLYNMIESKVLAVYESTSMELVKLFEYYADYFRNAGISNHIDLTSTTSNFELAKDQHNGFMQKYLIAKYGGSAEAIKRILAQLPISAQSYSSSPYLDVSLFSYDERWVSSLERPKPCDEHPIRFYARDTGKLTFRLQLARIENVGSSSRRIAAFTFHPTDPFAISVQRTNSEYVVNFHFKFDTQFEEDNYDYDHNLFDFFE